MLISSIESILHDSISNALPNSLPNALPNSLPNSLPNALPNALPNSLPIPYQIPYRILHQTFDQTLYRNDLARFLDHRKERSNQIFIFQHDASSTKFSRRWSWNIKRREQKTEASIFLIALLDYSNYRSQSTRWFDCAIYRSCRTLLILKLGASDRAYVKVQSQVHIHYDLHVVHWWSRREQECCDLQKLTGQLVWAVTKVNANQPILLRVALYAAQSAKANPKGLSDAGTSENWGDINEPIWGCLYNQYE